MWLRSAVVLFAILFSGRAPAPADGPDLLDGNDTIALTLEAPLRQLFERGQHDEEFTVPGALTYKDPRTGQIIVLRDIEVSLRGHSSRRETECVFPKLKLKFKESGSLKI